MRRFVRWLAAPIMALTIALGIVAQGTAITYAGITSTPQAPFKSGSVAAGNARVTTPCPSGDYNVVVRLVEVLNGTTIYFPGGSYALGGRCDVNKAYSAPTVFCGTSNSTIWVVQTRIDVPSGGGSAWDSGPGTSLACRA